MADMLTAKDMQHLLHVDRSTIYRMAEAGRLPAIKVGKQWRFPSDQVDQWLNGQTTPAEPAPLPAVDPAPTGDLAGLLPLDCVQLIQDSFADLLNVMLVVTHLDGSPITQVSHPTPFYNLLAETNQGHQVCQETWRVLGQTPALKPRFVPTLAGLLCARALVRHGHELKGMIIAFGVAPGEWPPDAGATTELAQFLAIDPASLERAFQAVSRLSTVEQDRILTTLQHIADILAHIVTERSALLGQLAALDNK
ncbi:MAG: PocR ligand-binding domain-containing protein [Anaerolineales bacterium]|nr:PocR ligand-binding domain-containing protein [Anaerolineales bacterium]